MGLEEKGLVKGFLVRAFQVAKTRLHKLKLTMKQASEGIGLAEVLNTRVDRGNTSDGCCGSSVLSE